MQHWLMAAVVLASPMVVFAGPQPKSEWKQCQQDSDCVAIKGVCRPATVNRAFKADAERYYALQAETTRCPAEFWHPPSPVPRCRLNSCEMVQKDSD
jgi:hypothetical protein